MDRLREVIKTILFVLIGTAVLILGCMQYVYKIYGPPPRIEAYTRDGEVAIIFFPDGEILFERGSRARVYTTTGGSYRKNYFGFNTNSVDLLFRAKTPELSGETVGDPLPERWNARVEFLKDRLIFDGDITLHHDDSVPEAGWTNIKNMCHGKPSAFKELTAEDLAEIEAAIPDEGK